MPALVGVLFFWMLSTASGFSLLLSIITCAAIDVLFEPFSKASGDFNEARAWTTIGFWVFYYVIVKIISVAR